MSKLTVTVELSPEIYVILGQLRKFYQMDNRQIIEMALEHLAADAKLIVETIEAKEHKTS